MTDLELSNELKIIVEKAPPNNRTMAFILFGIKFANDIRPAFSSKKILALAGYKPHNSVEIDYGINLAKFVQIKDDAKLWF